MPRETSSGAVIFRKENNKIYYLLLRYEAGHWGFPKGHIEKGESEEETMKREVEEETGIKDIKIISGFKEHIKYVFRNIYELKEKHKKSKDLWVFKVVTFYLAETKTKEVKISFEHTDFKWLTCKEAIKQLSFKNAKEILKKADQFLISNSKIPLSL